MKTIEKINKKGYKLIGCLGYRNGVQTTVNYQLIKEHGAFKDTDCGFFKTQTDALNACR